MTSRRLPRLTAMIRRWHELALRRVAALSLLATLARCMAEETCAAGAESCLSPAGLPEEPRPRPATPRPGASDAPAPRPYSEAPMPADSAPWQTFGAGCRPLQGLDHDAQLRALSNRTFNIAALPPESQAFACYSGTLTAELEEKPKLWRDAGFADSAAALVEDFLSAEGVDHFRGLLLEHAKVDHVDPTSRRAYLGGAQYGGMMISSHPHLDVSLPEDEILNAVEARIADVLGIPASNEEKHLQIVVTVEGPEKKPVQAIHHDKNSGMTRQATAIVYISHVEDGGETVFPALPLHPSGPVARTAEQQQIGKALKKLVKGQMENLQPEIPWPPLAIDGESELYEQMAKACPKSGLHAPSAGNQTAPLIVKPVPGRAIFFWHETRAKVDVIFDNFHMGCPVKKGVKLALQKFKHYASGNAGCQKARWCRVGMARAEEFSRMKEAFTEH